MLCKVKQSLYRPIMLLNVISVKWQLICVSYVFFHAELKCVIRIALSHYIKILGDTEESFTMQF